MNIASLAGLSEAPDRVAYCASKGAILNLTRQLAVDYGSEGLRVNGICPGVIETRMTESLAESPDGRRILDRIPTGRVGEPREVAKVAVFLVSDLASYVNGHNLVVDDGVMAHFS